MSFDHLFDFGFHLKSTKVYEIRQQNLSYSIGEDFRCHMWIIRNRLTKIRSKKINELLINTNKSFILTLILLEIFRRLEPMVNEFFHKYNLEILL